MAEENKEDFSEETLSEETDEGSPETSLEENNQQPSPEPEKDLASYREKGEEKEKNQDEKWLEYLDTKLSERRNRREMEEERIIEKAINTASEDFPELTKKEIIEAMEKYSKFSDNEDYVISPRIAAQILMDAKGFAGASKGLSQEELRRKKAASGISGKAGVESGFGVKPYNPEKDKGKDYSQLMEEGLKELGQ